MLKSIIFQEFKTNNKRENISLKLRSTQLLAIYYAVLDIIKDTQIPIINKKSSLFLTSEQKQNQKQDKGTIYQIETGEGKTIVICCISILLCLFGFKVHIITHNINLSFRDFMESQSFYKIFKIKSDFLCHKEEQNMLVKDIENHIYKQNEFKDPLDINTNVLNDSNIIYSTAFNFEGSYLTFMEKHPGYCPLSNTICLVDEADSMLIDEINNGTTISKPIFSDVEEAISKIYEIAEETQNYEMEKRKMILFEKLKFEFLLLPHTNLEELLSDADKVRNDLKLNLNYLIKDGVSFKNPGKIVPLIVPFEYKKGSVEENKRFERYIHQFIAIKENIRLQEEANEKKIDQDKIKFVEVEPLSINYLYISHPSYLLNYTKICGFTGTIGTTKDKSIYKEKYFIKTLKIPRHQPNFRFDLQPVLVDSIEERNNHIINELSTLIQLNKTFSTKRIHKRSVLIILENPNEIFDLLYNLLNNDVFRQIFITIKTGIQEIDDLNKLLGNIYNIEKSEIEAKIIKQLLKSLDNPLLDEEMKNKRLERISSLNDIAIKQLQKSKEMDIVSYSNILKNTKFSKIADNILEKTHKTMVYLANNLHQRILLVKKAKEENEEEEKGKTYDETKELEDMADALQLNLDEILAGMNELNELTSQLEEEVNKESSNENQGFFAGIFSYFKNKKQSKDNKEMQKAIDTLNQLSLEIREERDSNEDDSSNITIFDELSKPLDVIIAANNYGRGTNVDIEVNNGGHLHVIIGYYSQNMRSIYQALGRTGRSGKSGTTEIICTKKEYFSSLNKTKIDSNLDLIDSLNNESDIIQIGRNLIIERLCKTGHKWIFDEKYIDENIYKNLEPQFYSTIRKYTVNISRQVAVQYKFPFGFNVYDYFLIQSQRIYSLINCPNCFYVWKLIARYFRELVLVSWSLHIKNLVFKKILGKLNMEEILNRYFTDLDVYLPLNKPKIEDCFLHITNFVNKQNSGYLINSKYSKIFWNVGGSKTYFISLKLGAFPFTQILANETKLGIKYDSTTSIQDPELNYDKFSITKYLDSAFEFILSKINDFLTSHSGLQIYLKRTIAGTEFGFCFQPFTTNERLFMTLHDIDLTFIAAINVKSEKILLVSILLLLGSVLAACFSMIEVLILKLIKKGIKGILQIIFEEVAGYVADFLNDNVVDVICGFFIIKARNMLKERFYGSKIQMILKEIMEMDLSATIFGQLKSKGKFFAIGVKIIVSIIMFIAAFFESFSVQSKLKNENSSNNETVFDEKTISNFEKESKNAKKAMDNSMFIIENENEKLVEPQKTLQKSIDKSNKKAKKYVNENQNIEMELEKIKSGKSLKDYLD